MPRRYWVIVIATIIGAAAFAGPFVLAWGDSLVEQWHNAARFTARADFPIFILTYSASSLARLWPNPWTRALRQDRRQWGIAFAIAHTIHLAAFAGYIIVSGTAGEFVDPIVLGVAAPGYVVMYAMLATSNAASMKAMGKNWKRLHTFGIHLLWLNFAGSYAQKFFRLDGEPIGASYVYFPLCMLALGLRVVVWMRSNQRRAA